MRLEIMHQAIEHFLNANYYAFKYVWQVLFFRGTYYM